MNSEANKRSAWAAGLCLAVLACLSCNTDADHQRTPAWGFPPNILWLVAEDLGPYVAAFGDSTVSTPSLDRLAAEGVVYPRVFSPSGVCSPSRAAIATGMYPTRIGAHQMRTGPWYAANPAAESIARYRSELPDGIVPYEALPPPDARMHSEYMRMHGYYATNNAKNDYQFRAPTTAWDENGSNAHWRGRSPGQPFFAIFNFEVTHESRIWRKMNDPLLVRGDLDVPIPPYLPDTEIAKRDVRRMYSNIIEMDRQVGEVLRQLGEDGLLDSTIVVWYTDHGGPLPRQKRLLYDSGLNAPMIIRYPNGWSAGRVDDRLISFVDFLPTLLSLAGIRPPDNLDGRAFAGLHESATKRRYIHAAVDRLDKQPDGVRAVRTKRYKYLRHLDTNLAYYVPVAYREQMPIMKELLRLRDAGQLNPLQSQWFRPERPYEELFDTETDPHELTDLTHDPAYANKLDELRLEADRWLTETDDKGMMPESDYLRSIWPTGEQPSTSAPVAEHVRDSLVLRSSTVGALVGYQIVRPGEELTSIWSIHTEPIASASGFELVAIAHRIGFRQSDTLRVLLP